MAIVELSDLAHGGEAVGRLEGKAVFVAGGIPGERVRVEITEDARRYSRARLLQVLDPSPDRVSPPCPYYGDCGGCHLQHIRYERQLALKTEVVRTQLQRVAGVAEPHVLPMLGMAEPWGYRNQVQLHTRGRLIGYQRPRSHYIVPVARCLIAHPLLQAMWPRELPASVERVILRAGIATGERLALLEANVAPELAALSFPQDVALAVDLDPRLEPLRYAPWIHERLLGRTFRVSARVFFQNNTAGAEQLIRQAGNWLALGPVAALLDAYCGAGAFMLSLTPADGSCLGIESSSEAIGDARANARLNDRTDQAFFEVGDVGRTLAQHPARCDAVVLDPPRGGCSEEALAGIAATGARRIVYVSCDPATLARDIGRLARAGYHLECVQPVDMFPQTFHVECVALMSRVEKKV
jgi:23S rRNA (uracil1939-C5)-methyltransferase